MSEFLTRKEYDREHNVLVADVNRFARRTRWVLRFFVLTLIVFAVLGAIVINQLSDITDANHEIAKEAQVVADAAVRNEVRLREGLVKSCQVNGNPLREAVRKQIVQQIHQSQSFDYSKFFPNVPPKQLHHLIAKQIKQQRNELRSIPPVDCTTYLSHD